MSANIHGIRQALYRFYQLEARDLPWRLTRDPYQIWVSEVMLQQTQVKTVIPRFKIFIEQYPNLPTLAAASEAEICQAFAGLGYYHRARNLHRAATTIMDTFHGCLPQTYAELRMLPGLGNYTAAAVASIAFKQKVASVDGNVLRVLARVFMLPGARGDKKLTLAVQEVADAIVQDENPGDLNQAFMDLGASLCTPLAPECLRCPLQRFCKAYSAGSPERFPMPRTEIARKRLTIVFAWVERRKRLLVEQRLLTGLWPGLWELPSEMGEDAKKRLEKRLGIKLKQTEVQIKHMLTHREVIASVCIATKEPLPAEIMLPRGKFTATPLVIPLSTIARKAILAMTENRKAKLERS